MFDLYPADRMPRRDWLTGEDIPQIALQTEWPIGTKAASQTEGLAAYFACVSFTDTNVGRVTQTLDELDLWKNTIVVFMGDHGFHLGDHGLWSKKTLFEQSLRVPLVPAFKQCTAPNRTHGAPLSFGSCVPPDPVSDYLTVGTPDANGRAANSVGSVGFNVVPGIESPAQRRANRKPERGRVSIDVR